MNWERKVVDVRRWALQTLGPGIAGLSTPLPLRVPQLNPSWWKALVYFIQTYQFLNFFTDCTSRKGMPHSYKSEYPAGVQVDDGIKAFFEEFYKTSDTPDAHEKYADSFTGDATLVMASKKVAGREGTVHFVPSL
jgi:hypothetical protein